MILCQLGPDFPVNEAAVMTSPRVVYMGGDV